MKRRRFLKSMLALLGSTTLLSFLYPLLRFIAPPTGEARVERIVIPKDEVPTGGAKEVVYRETPVIIINRPGKGYIALSRVCTHLGCLVEYDGRKGRLICPCHAGVFSLDGVVLSGPPPKPLPRFSLRIEGENILIG